MKKLLLVLAISISLISCSKDDSSTTPKDPIGQDTVDHQPADQLVPLKVGNTWNYAIVMYQTSDNVEMQLSTSGTTIVSTNSVGGIKWYSVGESNGIHSLQINKSDGLYYYDTTSKQPMLGYKYPAKVGETFVSNGKIVKIGSVNESVTTDAGTFNCIRYDADYGVNQLYVYLCPNVGLIKKKLLVNIEDYGNGPDTLWQELRLTEYLLK